MSNKSQQEILTYNIYKQNNNINICIPVLGLTLPQFKLIDNSLCIYFLYNNKSYLIHNLKLEIINYIKNEQAYIVESLLYDPKLAHKIILNT